MDLLFHDAIVQVADIDRGLVKTLVYGVLRQKEYLDQIIRRFSKHPLRKMKPRTLMALRIGVYQLLFLSRIPESAAVNTTVNALKGSKQPSWLIGFVNGLLRNVARKRKDLPSSQQLSEADPPVLNHPSWLIERWQREYGMDTVRAICAANNCEPLLSLRGNRRKGSRQALKELMEKSGIKVDAGFFSPQALIVKEYPGSIASLPGMGEGRFQVQDEAAQLASLLVGELPDGGRVLDGCAGLGGKTSHLAELLPLGGTVTAVEPDSRRYRLMRENILRLGHQQSVIAVRSNLENFATTRPQPFDAILIDAPCSGTGVIRRQPDIRWNRSPEDFIQYQLVQLGLLATAVKLLRPGGTLVYATCSLEPEENHRVIEQFLDQFSTFTIENARKYLPENAHRLIDAQGCLRPNPADGLDGFFAARLTSAGSL
nr:16S rRNA (cytosine(967)-C(5))-methyltransferase RsmB [uncultured Desulfobulbus sp.]